MISVPKVEAYRLNALDHQDGEGGAPSLDVIATEHYGRQYVAQQTGDMLSNGSWTEYVMNKEDVEQYLFDGATVVKAAHHWEPDTYLAGREGIEHWLGLKAEDYDFDSQVYRQAPPPYIILADLIDKGILPYGTYLLYCWW